MTVDELIALAQDVENGRAPAVSFGDRLARGILEVLSTEATPCGLEAPRAVTYLGPKVRIPEFKLHGAAFISRTDARWLATAILRACDEAAAQGDSARLGEDLAELVRGAIALEAEVAAFLDEQEDR